MLLDQRVRKMRTQHLAEQHARQNDVVGELRLTDTLRASIDLAERLADNVQILGHRLHRLTRILIQSVDAFFRQFHFFATHARGGEFYRLVNLDIASTATQDFPTALPESRRASDSATSSTTPQPPAKTRASNNHTALHPDRQTSAATDEAPRHSPFLRLFLRLGLRRRGRASGRKELNVRRRGPRRYHTRQVHSRA